MEYIMGYNVKKEGFEKRCNDLVTYLDDSGKTKTTNLIINTVDEEVRYSGNKMMDEVHDLISMVYTEDILDKDIYYDWTFNYLYDAILTFDFQNFVLECDGFFSHLAIFEILELLDEMAEEDKNINEYILKNTKFIKLNNMYKEIINVLTSDPNESASAWVMHREKDGYSFKAINGEGTKWGKLEKHYHLESLIDRVADDIFEFNKCKEISEDLKELKNSILPENTLKREKIEDASSKPSKKQMRVDLPQALGVLAEARTEELIKLNEMFESAGESIKDIIESGEELNDEEEEIKNNIIRTMNREQALGEILSIYYGEEDVIDKNIRRMPTHIVFSTLEEWIENPPYMEDGEADEEKVREHNIFCERLTMSIKLVLNRIKSTMEREKENTEHANKEINNLDEALNILGAVRSMELNVVNEINERFKAEEDEDAKLELSIMGMSSIAKEKALRKVYVEITGSKELDYDNDGIVEAESAIKTLESWLKEPIESDDEEFESFCSDRNKAIEIVLYEIKKDLVALKKQNIGREENLDGYDPELIIQFKDGDFEDKIRRICNLTEDQIKWEDIIFCDKLDFSYESLPMNLSEDIRWFLNLREIDLSFSKINIDLDSLYELTSLEYLDLRSAEATGNISNLKNLTSLKSLILSFTKVKGDLDSLSELKSLEVLDLSYTDVSGELSELNKKTILKELELGNTGVLGNLSEIKHMKNLKTLELSDSLISGDISYVKDLILLEKIKLSGTAVFGDISNLSSLTSLNELDLSGLKVSGNITSLRDKISLEYLVLSHTNVAGDINNLSNLLSLRMLYLDYTEVSGDLTSLDHIENLSNNINIDSTDVYDSNFKFKYEVEDIDNYILINWSEKAAEILEIARKKLNLSEEVSVEDNLDKYPDFEKYKFDILTEAASLYNLKCINDFIKYTKEEFVSSKICNPREDTFIIGTSADDLSIFISTYILVTNMSNKNIKKFENKIPDSLYKLSNEEALSAELNYESLNCKLELLELNNQDWFRGPERGYQIGTILGYEKAIFKLKESSNIEKIYNFILEEFENKNEISRSIEGFGNEFYEYFFHGISGEAYGIIKSIIKKYIIGIDDAIAILEDGVDKLTMIEEPIEVESKYNETLYKLQKEHIARNLKAKNAISLLINLCNDDKNYSKESIDSAIEILEEFAVSPIAKLEDSLPRALANEFFEIAREYSFSSFSDDENIAMKVLLRETKNKYI